MFVMSLDKKEFKPCTALIFHGPGHQSRTKCMLRGPHTIHKAYYGRYEQLAQWEGDSAFSGFFDEPPDFNED